MVISKFAVFLMKIYLLWSQWRLSMEIVQKLSQHNDRHLTYIQLFWLLLRCPQTYFICSDVFNYPRVDCREAKQRKYVACQYFIIIIMDRLQICLNIYGWFGCKDVARCCPSIVLLDHHWYKHWILLIEKLFNTSNLKLLVHLQKFDYWDFSSVI